MLARKVEIFEHFPANVTDHIYVSIYHQFDIDVLVNKIIIHTDIFTLQEVNYTIVCEL